MLSSCEPQPGNATTRTAPLDSAFFRSATRLLDQQMWCFGQDIRHPEGNVLLRFGFQRHRQTSNTVSTSAYILAPYPSSQLVLWGFGLFYGQASCGGLFLRRYQFAPAWTPHARLPVIVWDASGIPNLRPARSWEEWAGVRRLFSSAYRWLAGYEQWVVDTFGLDYRQRCLQQWQKGTISAESVPAAWQSWADSFREAD